MEPRVCGKGTCQAPEGAPIDIGRGGGSVTAVPNWLVAGLSPTYNISDLDLGQISPDNDGSRNLVPNGTVFVWDTDFPAQNVVSNGSKCCTAGDLVVDAVVAVGRLPPLPCRRRWGVLRGLGQSRRRWVPAETSSQLVEAPRQLVEGRPTGPERSLPE